MRVQLPGALVVLLGVALGLTRPTTHDSRLTTGLATHDSRLTTRHDTHVSLTRLVQEDSAITARVRMFRDDLEHALARFHGTDSATVAGHPRLDSLIGAYLARTLVLQADGKALQGAVLQVGRERDEGNWEVTLVLVRYPLPRPVTQLVVRNDIMFELFPNQQNLVQALRLPGGERQTLYYAVGSGPQALHW